jgi:hypothetical protein
MPMMGPSMADLPTYMWARIATSQTPQRIRRYGCRTYVRLAHLPMKGNA